MKKFLIALALMAASSAWSVGSATPTLPGSPLTSVTASGTLGVSGTIEPSLAITLTSAGEGGIALGGANTNTASLSLGSFSKFGSAPAGTTVLKLPSTYRLTTAFRLRVDKANSASENYTLTAQLAAAPYSQTAWHIGSAVLSEAEAAVVANDGTYGNDATHWLMLTIDDAAPAGAIDNTVYLTATAN